MIIRNSVLYLLFAFCVASGTIMAQNVTPIPVGNQPLNNSFSVGSAVRKMQTLYLPADFGNNNSNGLITQLYLRGIGLNILNLSINDLQIKMRQVQTQSFNGTQFFDSLQPVITTVPLRTFQPSMVSGSYLVIPLDFPFNYDRTLPLVVEISSTNASSNFTAMGSTKTGRRLFASQTNATTGTLDNLQWSLGFDLVVPTGPNAAIQNLLEPIGERISIGKYPVRIQLRNLSSDTLRQLQLNWRFGNQSAGVVWSGSVLPGLGFEYQFADSLIILPRMTDTLRIWAAQPNGQTDVVPSNDSIFRVLRSRLNAGSYTVGRSGSDFVQLQDAIAYIEQAGISGNVVFEIESGNYNTAIALNATAGIDSLNQLHIRSKAGIPDSVVIESATAPAIGSIAANFVQLSHLTLRRTGVQSASNAGVINLQQCRQWRLRGCKLEVVANPYNEPFENQRNIFTNDVRDLSLVDCDIKGGAYALVIIGNSSESARNISIDSSRITDQVGGIYNLTRVNNFRFSHNVVQKSIQRGASFDQLVHFFSPGFEVKNNRFDVVTNAHFLRLTSSNRMTSSSVNLFANNVIRLHLRQAGSLLFVTGAWGTDPPNSIQFEHNNALVISDSITLPDSWGILNYHASQSNSYGVCNVVNNLFKWQANGPIGGGNMWFLNTQSIASITNTNRNLYNLPAPNTYVQRTTGRAGIGALASWDNQSYVLPFELDSAVGYRINVPINSRWSTTSAAVNVDFTGRQRQLPQSDLGAYEALSPSRPLFLTSLLTDTVATTVRNVTAEYLPVQAGDTIEARLFYKGANQQQWANVTGRFVGNNRYVFGLLYSLIDSTLIGPASISYYFAYRLPGGSWATLPEGGSINQAPANPYSFVATNLLATTIRVGAQGDVPDLYAAMTALSQNTIRRSVTLLLTDSVYNVTTAGILLGNHTITDTSLVITIRPDLGRHVVIRDLTGNKWMFQAQTRGHFRFIGRDVQGNGSITWQQNNASGGGGAIYMTRTTQSRTVTVSHMRFIHSNQNNAQIALQADNYPQDLAVQHNEFVNYGSAIIFNNVQNGLIENNTFGDSIIPYRAVVDMITLNQSNNAKLQRNKVHHVVFRNNGTSFSILTIRNARNTQLLNNTFSKIGYAPLFADQNTFQTRRASIVRLDNSFDSLLMIGNLIEQISLPINRADSTSPGTSVKEFYIVRSTGLNAEPTENLIFLHNTILASGNYFGNCASRFYAFALKPMRNVLIQNNLFGLDLKGNPQRFKGALFAFSSEFSQIINNTTIGHNVYLLDSAASFPFFWKADTIPINGLTQWRNEVAFPGRQQEQISFQLTGNLSQLVPAASTPLVPVASRLKANAFALTLPGISNSDLNNQLRSPADIGAYQVQSAFRIENTPPTLSQIQFDTTSFACLGATRQFSVQVADTGSRVATVALSLWNGLTTEQIPLTLSTGNRQLGTWSATSAVDTNLRYAMASFVATDSAGNVQYSNQFSPYHNYALIAKIEANPIISTQNGIRATAKTPENIHIAFSEIVYQRNTPGFPTVFPPYANGGNSHYLELTNYGADTLDLSNYKVRLSSTDTLVFPTPYLVPPRAVILITEGALSAQPNNHYFTHPGLSAFTLSQNRAVVLLAPDGQTVIDAVYLDRYFGTPFGIISGTWNGQPIPTASGNFAGFKLDGLDLNLATNWIPITAANPGNLGFFNLSNRLKPSIQYQWGGILQGNRRETSRGTLPGGNYQITLQANTGTCNVTDTFSLRVSGNDSTDVVPPTLSELQFSPSFNDLNCTNGQRWLSVRAQDTATGSGVAEVTLLIQNSIATVHRLMSRANGNPADGIYNINLANETNSGFILLVARDLNNNVSDILHLPYFHSRRLQVNASNDTVINAGDSVLLIARSTGRDRSAIQLTEVAHLPGGSGFQPLNTLPPGLVLNASGTNDVYEITNTGRDFLSTHGLLLRVHLSFSPINIPLPSIIMAPQSQLFVVMGNPTSAPNTSNVFYINPAPYDLISGNSHGITLIDTLDAQPYLTAVAVNGYVFPANLNIPAAVWSGAGMLNVGGSASIYRTSTSPNNTGWTVSNQNQNRISNLGSSIAFPQLYDTVQWFGPAGFLGTGDSLRVSPLANTLYRAQVNNGTCVASDSIFVTVVGGNQQNDIAVVNLIQPAANQTNPFSVNPQVILVNGGNSPVSRIPLAFSVNGSFLHSDTVQSLLMPGDTLSFTSSSSWQVPLGGVYQFCVRAFVAGDNQPGNDSVCVQTFGREARQFAQLIEILNPVVGANIRDSVQVRVRITNAGTDTLQSLRLSFADSTSATIEQLFNVFLLPNQQQTISFNRFYVPSDSSSNRLCVRVLGSWPNSLCQQLGGISTSVRPIEKFDSEVQVYPNPANDKIFVSVSQKNEMRKVELYDSYGKLLQQIIPEDAQRSEVDMRFYSSGMYLLRIYSVDAIITRRIIVRH